MELAGYSKMASVASYHAIDTLLLSTSTKSIKSDQILLRNSRICFYNCARTNFFINRPPSGSTNLALHDYFYNTYEYILQFSLRTTIQCLLVIPKYSNS